MLAVAAYNGGLANVDRWVVAGRRPGRQLTTATIPFPETRAYVERVLSAQQDYRNELSAGARPRVDWLAQHLGRRSGSLR